MAILNASPLVTDPSVSNQLEELAIANLVGALDVLVQMDLKLNGYPEAKNDANGDNVEGRK